ncbi:MULTISPECIES: hypothetical protein [unclassified Leifsonia]|uniref:hypothetical protein n=1 Tax=unclassified Leifsonia TaxID=2663824 RepID=UPI0006F3D83C|nr:MULTISPECIES: hypothetical protein [unclassified Leifsonia]KQX07620.1 hypothetical protein ASC59_07730 [Leifsonia sp. Root1293]KRA11902.1 hypothetical protein ASD61_07730 [Leifsonia sp. Root60]
MTDTYRTDSPASGGAATGTTDAVKGEAANVKDQVVGSTKNVAATAKDEASGVIREAKSQASDLFGQVTSELREQAATQQSRAAAGLRTIGDDLDQMSQASSSGLAAELVSQASSRASSISRWLDERDPESLLDEVKNFARRRPGTFIAVAAVVGLVAGRITRSAVSNHSDASDGTAGTSSYRPAVTPDVHTDTYSEPFAVGTTGAVGAPGTTTATGSVGTTGAIGATGSGTDLDTDVYATPGGPASGSPTTTPVYSALTGDGTRTGPDSDTAPAFGDDTAAERDDSSNEFGAGNAQRSWGDGN